MLGLTVAESMLLILFALLIAVAALLFRRDQLLRQIQAELVTARHDSNLVRTKASILEAMVEHRPLDQFVQEVTQAREEETELRERERLLRQRAHALEEETQLAQAIHAKPDKRAEIARLAAVGERAESEMAKYKDIGGHDAFDVVPAAVDAVDTALKAGYSPKEAASAFTAAAKESRDIATLRGQIVKLRNDLAKVGRGADWPPCWVTSDGHPEFLFNIALLSNGHLRIQDTTPAWRVADRANLQLPGELTGVEQTPSRFLALTVPLYAFEKSKDCRFYVTVVDGTAANQKTLFKALLLTVEDRFYKLLRRPNERP